MKRSVGAGVSTRRSGRSGPARSGAIGLRPLGGLGPHPPVRGSAADGLRFRQDSRSQQGLRMVGGGPSIRPSG